MSEHRTSAIESLDPDAHRRTAREFARRIQGRPVEDVEELFLFGSTARGEAAGIDSDVDFLAIVADNADRPTVADELRDVAYNAMLEFGPVVEVHVLSRAEFERRRERGNPFVRNVLREGRSYG